MEASYNGVNEGWGYFGVESAGVTCQEDEKGLEELRGWGCWRKRGFDANSMCTAVPVSLTILNWSYREFPTSYLIWLSYLLFNKRKSAGIYWDHCVVFCDVRHLLVFFCIQCEFLQTMTTAGFSVEEKENNLRTVIHYTYYLKK